MSAASEARVNVSAMRRLTNALAAIVLPTACVGSSMPVIFDAEYQRIDIASGVSTSGPRAAVLEVDMPAQLAAALVGGQAVSLQIRGTTYIVAEHEPDGTGWTELRLRK